MANKINVNLTKCWSVSCPQLPEYLESMLGKMAKDMPGLIEKMAEAANNTSDMVRNETLKSRETDWSGFILYRDGVGRRVYEGGFDLE